MGVAKTEHVHISRQHAADDVAEMGHIVHVRQRTCDQDVPLACSQRIGLCASFDNQAQVRSEGKF